MHSGKTNVEYEICEYTGTNWSHCNTDKGLKKNLETMPGKYAIVSFQKTTILETSHLIREVLQSKN
jgi:hypothetical protein